MKELKYIWIIKNTFVSLQKNKENMSDFNFKRTPLGDEMVIKGERFVKVSENKEKDIICYRREWKDCNGNINYCYEVIKPVGKDRHYPCSEDFGTYGLCISKNDRYLKEKIDWYINNGLSKRFEF